MYHLVYLSTAAKKCSEEDLLFILEQSRKNNALLEITGLLIYLEGMFIQLLEGSKENVRKIFYDKINVDSRHIDVVVLFEGPLEERNFSNWTMAFNSLTLDETERILGYRPLDSSGAWAKKIELSDHPAMQVIKHFYKSQK